MKYPTYLFKIEPILLTPPKIDFGENSFEVNCQSLKNWIAHEDRLPKAPNLNILEYALAVWCIRNIKNKEKLNAYELNTLSNIRGWDWDINNFQY